MPALSSCVIRESQLHLVLSCNRNSGGVYGGYRVTRILREVAMKNVPSYRALALLCRQQAVFHPEKR
jgi:hypothetical protein